ncbi:MAG: hypothetical protein KA045_01770 [Burkholderiaceae bacterium]|nr:hypothetical protein [Burkholderiaceae bacterium]
MPTHAFQQGDMLFTQLGNISDNAIAAVTEGLSGALVNHVGVVVENKWGIFVLEAFPPEVRVTSLEVFLKRSWASPDAPRFLHLRLKPTYADLLPPAIQYGLTQRNIPYDARYLTDEAALYCSELVVDMFTSANGGLAFFIEKPMSFRDKLTGEILPAWIQYYKIFGMEVPDGEPGSNPGDLSKDDKLVLVQAVGPLVGWRGTS